MAVHGLDTVGPNAGQSASQESVQEESCGLSLPLRMVVPFPGYTSQAKVSGVARCTKGQMANCTGRHFSAAVPVHRRQDSDGYFNMGVH